MKSLLLIAGMLLSLQAGAQQINQCGDTLRTVANIINQQFRELDAGETVRCFKADWGYGVVIELDKPLVIGGMSFMACPQANGSVYMHIKGTPEQGGYFTCQGATLKGSGFGGAIMIANGIFERQGTMTASRPSRRR